MTRNHPPNDGSDQRYWRRQANLRVRKARRIRALLRWSVVVLANVLVLGTVLLPAVRIVHKLRSSEEFRLDRIELFGIRSSSTDRIRSNLEPLKGENLLDLDLNLVVQIVAQDPWVETASVKRVLPDTVRVSIKERQPVALAVIGGLTHLVDANGHVIGPAGRTMSYDFPVLVGLEDLDREQLVRALREGAAHLARLTEFAAAFVDTISEIDLSHDDRIRVRTIGRGPLLLLDPEAVERNLQHYLALSTEIHRRVGRAEYVDLRWRNRISVKPDDKRDFQMEG